ncbi:hypothetical protein MAR_024790, partial [Mya arenaria]
SEVDRPLQFYDVKAHPVPIVTPGTLYVSFRGNITYDLPRDISFELGLVKYFIGIPFPLPCFDSSLGSCCPFKSGEFNVKNLPLNIPKIRGFARAFIRGDYGLKLRVLDSESTELGCLQLEFSVKKRYRGWLFKI